MALKEFLADHEFELQGLMRPSVEFTRAGVDHTSHMKTMAARGVEAIKTEIARSEGRGQ